MNGLTQREVADVLGLLAIAQREARGSTDLPFALSCIAGDAERCAGNGRIVLSRFDLRTVTTIEQVPVNRCVRLHFEYPGDWCPSEIDPQDRTLDHYVISFGKPAGGWSWRLGLRPDNSGEVSEIELEYDFVSPGTPPPPPPPLPPSPLTSS